MSDSSQDAERPKKVHRSWSQRLVDFIIGRDPNKKPPETLGLMVKENAEAFLFAIVLVIVVRHFSLTPFRIPSASMEPTLLGNSQINDRLFVNRWAYEMGELRRWDVVVFLYPLNEDKHFIKRMVGMPGEEIFIANGDVYVRQPDEKQARILRKPPEVQKAMWVSMASLRADRSEGHWTLDDSFVYGRRGDFTLDGTSKDAWARFVDPKAEYTRPGSKDLIGDSDNVIVGDLRVTIDVGALPSGATALVRIVSGKEVFLVELPAGGKGKLLHESDELGKTVELPLEKATPAGAFTVSLAHLDRQAILIVDGEEWLRHDYDALRENGPIRPDQVRNGTGNSSVGVGARGAKLALTDLRVERDLHYVNAGLLADADRGYTLQPHRYFMMGDNSANSSDSRQWTVRVTTVRDKQTGKVRRITGEHNRSSRGKTKRLRNKQGTIWEFLDHKGRWQPVDTTRETIVSEVLHGPQNGNAIPEFSTVHRDQIIGRAFLIFWPPRRLGFIR